MTKRTEPKAIIYTRTACASLGDAAPLSEQEAQCRAFAVREGLNVAEVFGDLGSGNDRERHGLTAMLSYLDEHRGEVHAVVVEDVSRLARNVSAYADICDAIRSSGGVIQLAGVER